MNKIFEKLRNAELGNNNEDNNEEEEKMTALNWPNLLINGSISFS